MDGRSTTPRPKAVRTDGSSHVADQHRDDATDAIGRMTSVTSARKRALAAVRRASTASPLAALPGPHSSTGTIQKSLQPLLPQYGHGAAETLAGGLVALRHGLREVAFPRQSSARAFGKVSTTRSTCGRSGEAIPTSAAIRYARSSITCTRGSSKGAITRRGLSDV